MTGPEQFDQLFAQCPPIAILRGIRPDYAEAIGDALYEGEIKIFEVPLNSPDPLESIVRMSARFGDRALIGAGTVLSTEQVDQVRAAGGKLIVSPSTNTAVISVTVAGGMVSCPGYFTPSEAFAALMQGRIDSSCFPPKRPRQQ